MLIINHSAVIPRKHQITIKQELIIKARKQEITATQNFTFIKGNTSSSQVTTHEMTEHMIINLKGKKT